MMRCAKYWYSWDADNTDERRLAQILLIISKINLRPSALSASGNINLAHSLICKYGCDFIPDWPGNSSVDSYTSPRFSCAEMPHPYSVIRSCPIALADNLRTAFYLSVRSVR